jgi:hypothetical protein
LAEALAFVTAGRLAVVRARMFVKGGRYSQVCAEWA